MAKADTLPFPPASDLEPLRSDLANLAGLLKAHAPYDGSFDLRLPGVHVTRTSRVHKELVHGVLSSSLCLVAQGAKRVMLGQEIYEYDASRMLVYSVDVPVAAQGRVEHRVLFLRSDERVSATVVEMPVLGCPVRPCIGERYGFNAAP